MEKVLTPEELDLEEERLRKERAAKKAALLYFTQAYMEKVVIPNEAAAKRAIYEAVFKGFDMKNLERATENCARASYSLSNAEKSMESVKNFFLEKMDASEKEALQEDIKQLEISESDFATLALFGCGRNAEKLIRHFHPNTDTPEEPEENAEAKINEIRDEGILQARAAISQFKKGDPSTFAHILAGGLFMACAHFASEPDETVAMQWSLYVRELLGMFEARPLLAPISGITDRQMKIAYRVASLGADVKEGLDAIKLVNDIKIDENGKIYNPQTSDEVNAKFLKMREALRMRRDVVKAWEAAEKQPDPEVPAAGPGMNQ